MRPSGVAGDEPDGGVEVDEQIDIAGVAVFTSSDAAEDTHVARAPTLAGAHDSAAVTSEPTTERGIRKAEGLVADELEIDPQFVPCRVNELAQRV